MPESEEKPRHWYEIKRVQGMAIMVAGIAMLFNPITAPHAGTVIAVGAGWTGVGVAAKLTRGK